MVRNVVKPALATLAETQSSVSSVGVQSKGSFIVFLIIKHRLKKDDSNFYLHTYLTWVLEVVCRLLEDNMSVGCVLMLGL